MGVEKFLISSSLLAVLAQRLVRKLCNNCKCEDESTASHELYGLETDVVLYKSVGCKVCNFTGYTGRVAIGELFVLSDEIKEYLKGEVDDDTLMRLAVENKMIPLHTQLKSMLINGDTSVDEAVRIGIK
jgi:general secretion pathway protein E